ncbi:hypothetical protein BGX33_009584 [Mortierella sp. NVP41]|nr:hypothetical protein BGX33_009584 [Mortierella sp. NVP41]
MSSPTPPAIVSLADATAYQKHRYFDSIFMDPWNVQALIDKPIDTDTLASSSSSQQSSTATPATATPRATNPAAATTGGSLKYVRLLQFYPTSTSCENIFRVAVFLSNNLREFAKPEDDKLYFSLAKDEAGFRALTTRLGVDQPTLKEVNAYILHSCYMRLLKESKDLDGFIAAGNSWTETKPSLLAAEIVGIDSEIRAQDVRREAGGLMLGLRFRSKRQLEQVMQDTGTRPAKTAKEDMDHEYAGSGQESGKDTDLESTPQPRTPTAEGSTSPTKSPTTSTDSPTITEGSTSPSKPSTASKNPATIDLTGDECDLVEEFGELKDQSEQVAQIVEHLQDATRRAEAFAKLLVEFPKQKDDHRLTIRDGHNTIKELEKTT